MYATQITVILPVKVIDSRSDVAHGPFTDTIVFSSPGISNYRENNWICHCYLGLVLVIHLIKARHPDWLD